MYFGSPKSLSLGFIVGDRLSEGLEPLDGGFSSQGVLTWLGKKLSRWGITSGFLVGFRVQLHSPLLCLKSFWKYKNHKNWVKLGHWKTIFHCHSAFFYQWNFAFAREFDLEAKPKVERGIGSGQIRGAALGNQDGGVQTHTVGETQVEKQLMNGSTLK